MPLTLEPLKLYRTFGGQKVKIVGIFPQQFFKVSAVVYVKDKPLPVLYNLSGRANTNSWVFDIEREWQDGDEGKEELGVDGGSLPPEWTR